MEHYYSPEPTSASDLQLIRTSLAGHDFIFETDSSVFARQKLDYGTRLLLQTCLDECATWPARVLDLGCGYGPIGIIMQKLCSRLQLTLLDVNQRAVHLARRNLQLNGLKGPSVIQSDGLAADQGPYGVILTNPPIRAGKLVVYELFAQAARSLQPAGLFYLVIQKKQGAASARRELADLFASVQVIARSAGYQVIRCQKNTQRDKNMLKSGKTG